MKRFLVDIENVLLGITTVVPILGKEIYHSHFLAYPKEYAHGFTCFVIFILRIHFAIISSIYPYFAGLISFQYGDRIIVELPVKMSSGYD